MTRLFTLRLSPVWLALTLAYACGGNESPTGTERGGSGSISGGRAGASGGRADAGESSAGKGSGGTDGEAGSGQGGEDARGGSDSLGGNNATGGNTGTGGTDSRGGNDGTGGARGGTTGTGGDHGGATGTGGSTGTGGDEPTAGTPGSAGAGGDTNVGQGGSDVGGGTFGGAGGEAGNGGEGGAGVPFCADGVDADGDGYGVGCPAGNDCNDFERSIHPGAREVCGNGFDDDCDATTFDTCPVTCPEAGCGAGCADGTREAFKDAAAYPHIAGCDGGFSVPGVLHATTPTCGRAAGNDSSNPNGDGCGAADLCAPGWHVCRHPQEVAAHSPDGCVGSHDAANSFFITRQSGSGCGACAISTDPSKICTNADCNTDCYPTELETNDVFGCGTAGAEPLGSCAPLDRFSQDACSSLPSPWDCAASGGYDEALLVRKAGPGAGGVLCCSD